MLLVYLINAIGHRYLFSFFYWKVLTNPNLLNVNLSCQTPQLQQVTHNLASSDNALTYNRSETTLCSYAVPVKRQIRAGV